VKIREVRAANQAKKTGGAAVMKSLKWCSPTKAASNPAGSA